MTQALRVALWVPTEDPPEVGDGIVVKANEIAADVLPTRFVIGGAVPGGGVPEAPIDGNVYGRRDAGWFVVGAGAGGGIAEAPIDGRPYVRQSTTWVSFAIIDGGTF